MAEKEIVSWRVWGMSGLPSVTDCCFVTDSSAGPGICGPRGRYPKMKEAVTRSLFFQELDDLVAELSGLFQIHEMAHIANDF